MSADSLKASSQVEYFYSAHSAYAYIGSAKLRDLCRRHQCSLVHRPFNLMPVIEQSGSVPLEKRTPAQLVYYFGRQIARWAEFRDVPISSSMPTHHLNPLELPNGMLIAAAEQGADVDSLAHALLQAHWCDDLDLADAAGLAATAKSAGIDPEPLLAVALSSEIQAIHEQNTQEAIVRGVFGSPTYFVDGDMFYGQDHLELVERALVRPFSGAKFANPNG